jgi:hypothetical protein
MAGAAATSAIATIATNNINFFNFLTSFFYLHSSYTTCTTPIINDG